MVTFGLSPAFALSKLVKYRLLLILTAKELFDNDTPYLGDAGSEDPMEAWPH